MASFAKSFQVATASPARVLRDVGQALRGLTRPAGGFVFLGGALAARVVEVAETLAEARLGVPLTVVAGSGVLSDEGELEDQSGASGVVWAGGSVELCPIRSDDPEEFGVGLAQLLADRTGKTSPTVIVFTTPEAFGPGALMPLRESRGSPYLFGAGTVTSPGVVSIDASGVTTVGAVAVILRGISPPAIRTTHSLKLIAPLEPITEARGALVLEIGGRPALEALSDAGKSIGGKQLILLALAEAEGAEDGSDGHPAMIVRGVQGIDNDRGGLVVSDEVYEGMRLGFAIRDAGAARDDLETMTRELARDIGGAAPRFGLYMNCSGRGFGLYGTPGVDTRVLKARFPGLPFAGMQSAFEIAPHLSRPTMQLYTGVFALFTALS